LKLKNQELLEAGETAKGTAGVAFASKIQKEDTNSSIWQ
jgi:hypothetical protein